MSGVRHYEVVSPEIVRGGSSYEPPEEFCCSGIYLAPNAHAARAMAVKDPAFKEWVREARGDGHPPFKGLVVHRPLCEHGVCWGCTECPACMDVVGP